MHMCNMSLLMIWVFLAGIRLGMGVENSLYGTGEPFQSYIPTLPFCRKQGAMALLSLPVLLDVRSGFMEMQQRLVIYGGKGSDYTLHPTGPESILRDMWSLHVTEEAPGFVWTQLFGDTDLGTTFPTPTARWKFGLSSFDDASQLALFGGENVSNGTTTLLGDTWVFDPNQPTGVPSDPWTVLSEYSSTVSHRQAMGFAVTNGGVAVVQGGKSSLGDELQCDSHTFSVDLHGLGIGSDWEFKAPLPAQCRWGHTLTTVQMPTDVDTVTEERMLLFGGRYYNGTSYIYFDEVWSYDPSGDTWELLSAEDPNGPLARDHHSAVYVAESEALFIFAGRASEEMETQLSDLWSFSLRTLVWTYHGDNHQGHHHIPNGRFGHAMAVWRGGLGTDAPQLVLFGGEALKKSGKQYLMNDVWTWNVADGLWRKIGTSDCDPGATGELGMPVLPLNALFALAAIILIVGVLFVLCRAVKGRHKHEYVAVRDGEIKRSSIRETAVN